MSVELPSCYTFLANSAPSLSRYSTWCFESFLLENKRFLHFLQFPVHGTAHDACKISLLSINRFLATSFSCYTTRCLLNFPHVITRFSHTLQLCVHGTAHGVCWNFLHVYAVLFEPHHRLPFRWIWKSNLKIWEYLLLSPQLSRHNCFIGRTCAVVGCSEKLRKAKSNYGCSYFMVPWYIKTEKTRFFQFRVFSSLGGGHLKISLTLL